MKKITMFSVLAVLAVCIVAGIFMTGCETGGATVALTVEPSFVDLSMNSNGTAIATNFTQTFTATGGLRELSLPLEWSVSDPNLGEIAASGGYTASYVRYEASGDNSIIVRDQYGAEGVATIRQ